MLRPKKVVLFPEIGWVKIVVQTIKDRALCFSTKKSAVGVVFYM